MHNSVVMKRKSPLIFILLFAFVVGLVFVSCDSEIEQSFQNNVCETSHITSISAIVTAAVGKVGIENQGAEVGILYSSSPDVTPINATSVKAKDVSSSGLYKVLLNYLTPNTRYFWRPYVLSGQDVSMGEIQSFTTKGVDGIIASKPAEGVSESGATIVAHIDTKDVYYGKLRTGFIFGLSKNDLGLFLDCEENDGVMKRILDKLIQGTTYYYSATIYIDDLCLHGDTLSFSTNAIPDIVHSEQASDIGMANATLNAAIDTTGLIFKTIEYGFLFGERATNLYKAGADSFVDGKISLMVGRLTPNTTYYYQPYVTINDVEQHLGGIVSFTTNKSWVLDASVVLKEKKTGMQVIMNGIGEAGCAINAVVLKKPSKGGTDNYNEWESYTTISSVGAEVFIDLPLGSNTFGVYLEDPWQNTSKVFVIDVSIKYQERLLDKSLFSYASVADDNCKPNNSVNYPIEALWDGSGLSSIPHFFVSKENCPSPAWLTIDLGKAAQLSRIQTLPRIGYVVFGGGAVRDYEFWGSSGEMQPDGSIGKPSGKILNPTIDNPYGFDTNVWFPLGSFTQAKPSGYLDNGLVGTITSDDIQEYNAGNNFELDPEQYPRCNDAVRYLRVVFVNTFNTFEYGHDASNRQIQTGEITPWELVQ